MDDRKSPPSLDSLADRVKRARGDENVTRHGALGPQMPGTAMGLAFRVGVELVAGVAVGAAIGYGLDQWLGTTPWFMILFFFLGAGGGMMNVYRSVTGQGFAVGYREGIQGTGKPDGDTPDDDRQKG